MIRGAVDPEGIPWLRARVFLPSLSVEGYVWFLVDTGADMTSLHPFDSRRLGVPLDALDYTESRGGIGGSALYAPQPALIIVRDVDRDAIWYPVNLQIGQPTEENGTIPSLLGRDILSHLTMRFAPRSRDLEFFPF